MVSGLPLAEKYLSFFQDLADYYEASACSLTTWVVVVLGERLLTREHQGYHYTCPAEKPAQFDRQSWTEQSLDLFVPPN